MTSFANKRLLPVIAMLLVVPALISSPPSMAAPGDQADGNIFTPPSKDSQAPAFIDGGPGGRMRHQWAAGRDDVPELRQVQNLPSLTPEQRQQVREILKQSKQQIQPIAEQMRSLKEKYQGDQKQAMGDPDSREKFMDLRRQVRDARKQSWEQVKKVLSDQQLQELDAMRRGEMQPTTFNGPLAGSAKPATKSSDN